MRTATRLVLAALCAMAATSCGTDDGGGATSAAGSGEGGTERITANGVAAVVEDHLGDEVAGYGTYTDSESPESVDVMVQLEASRRDMFAVQVMSPEAARQEYGMTAKVTCERLQRGRVGGKVWCEDLPGGGVASVTLVPYGFSDDNAGGKTLMATGSGADGRFATVMYESYDPQPAVEPERLLELMSDERLSWTTDAAVNDAGDDVEVRKLQG